MKHCPNCINEFIDEAELDACPDCGIPLVNGPNPRLEPDYLPEPAEQIQQALVVLTKVGEVWQAEMLRGRLEAEGIESAQNPSATNAWLHIPPIEVTDMIEILVTEADLADAQKVLKELETEADGDIQFCPFCFGQISKADKECLHCHKALT